MSQKTLFVIFHGTFAFLDTGESGPIVVRPPDMGNDHTYRAGSWLAEYAVNPQDTYILINVDLEDSSSANNFNPGLNIIVQGAKEAYPSDIRHHAKFVFPRPKRIYSLAQIELVYTENGKPTTKKTSLIQVFEYTFSGTPMLFGHGWRPNGKTAPETLHVFAEHEREIDKDHASLAFHAAASLLGANYGLKSGQPAKQQEPYPRELKERCYEFEPLHQRRARLERLGILKVGKQKLDSAWEKGSSGCIEEWLNRFTEADNPTCSPVVGRG